jgi:16S rRNA (cytosine967-C5)-methyltransferase
LQLSPEQRILDACAAPGSKTSHILEMEPNINKVVAIDIDAERLFRVKENIQRLQLAADKLKMLLEDAGHTKQWWDGSPFQRILLDAPCSATGVIRRHPDIKLLRRENDIDKQCQLQKLLLKSLWPLLEKNGLFLYTTCSILKMENEAVITKFIKDTPDAKVIPCNLGCGQVLKYGTQLLTQKVV